MLASLGMMGIPRSSGFLGDAKLVAVAVTSQEMGTNVAESQRLPIARNGDSCHRGRGVLGAGESPLRLAAGSGTRRIMTGYSPRTAVRPASGPRVVGCLVCDVEPGV